MILRSKPLFLQKIFLEFGIVKYTNSIPETGNGLDHETNIMRVVGRSVHKPEKVLWK